MGVGFRLGFRFSAGLGFGFGFRLGLVAGLGLGECSRIGIWIQIEIGKRRQLLWWRPTGDWESSTGCTATHTLRLSLWFWLLLLYSHYKAVLLAEVHPNLHSKVPQPTCYWQLETLTNPIPSHPSPFKPVYTEAFKSVSGILWH